MRSTTTSAVCRQVLQMPFQSLEVRRKRLADTNERLLRLVAVQAGEVIGNCTLEQYARSRQSHVGSIGMGWPWPGRARAGTQLLGAALEVADNWMNLHRVEPTLHVDNEPALARCTANSVSRLKAGCAITLCATAYLSTP